MAKDSPDSDELNHGFNDELTDEPEDLIPEDDAALARKRKIKRLLEERFEQRRLREDLGLFDEGWGRD